MAYQISYDTSGNMKKTPNWMKYIRKGVKIFLVSSILIALVYSGSSDWRSTLHALEGMALELGQGSGIKEAFSGFCLDVLGGADLG